MAIEKSYLAAFIVLGFGFLFFMLGFCAPYWHQREGFTVQGNSVRTYYGLWKHCYEETKYRQMTTELCFSTISTDYGRDYIRATQFFETVGFLAALASLILLLLCVIISSCRDRKILPILSAIFAFAACGCIILGCIIFGAKSNEKDFLSWAFALALVGGLIFGGAGIIVFIFAFMKKPVQNSTL